MGLLQLASHVGARGTQESRVAADRPPWGTSQTLCHPRYILLGATGGPAQPDLKGGNQEPSPNASSQSPISLSVGIHAEDT